MHTDRDSVEMDTRGDSFDEKDLIHQNWSGWNNEKLNPPKPTVTNKHEAKILSLHDFCSQSIARHLPFELVQNYYPPIPEHSQVRIAFYSFPTSISEIRLYSFVGNGQLDDFKKANDLVLQPGVVRNALQIGFHLSAEVFDVDYRMKPTAYQVSVTFDRCKITSCSCECFDHKNESNSSWCLHVIALCLFRLKSPDKTQFRAPVSESLSRLNREKLQKFAQYLLNELPKSHLSIAQEILDKLLGNDSDDMNILPGGPDPTAGSTFDDDHEWFLDRDVLTDNIKRTIAKFCSPSPIVTDINGMYSNEPPDAMEYNSLLRPLRSREPEGIWNLLSIVKEMICRGDKNGIVLMTVITDSCLEYNQLAIWWYQTQTSTPYLQAAGNVQRNTNHCENIAQQAAAHMMDTIVKLWTVIIYGMESVNEEMMLRISTWQSKTVAAIRTGRFRENQLENLPAFKPALTATRDMINKVRDLCPYMRCRANVAYGHMEVARVQARRLADDLLTTPPDLFIAWTQTKDKDTKSIHKARLRQATFESIRLLENIEFLVSILMECEEHQDCAFILGLYALALRRPPSANKAAEVRLFHIQTEIVKYIKQIKVVGNEGRLSEIRKYASRIIAADEEGWIGQHPRDGHILPLILARFIFESLDAIKDNQCDRELGFWAATVSLGFKLCTSENEHPLLCEGTRRQKGELALKLLVKFKEDPSTLGTILEKLLDKMLAPNLKSSSVFGERRATSPIPVQSDHAVHVPRQIRSQSSADEGSTGYGRDTHGRRKSHSRTSPCNRLRKNRGMFHCSVNSSASEEAMLSDEDSRLRGLAPPHQLRPASPISSEGARESDTSSDSENGAADNQLVEDHRVIPPVPAAPVVNPPGNNQLFNHASHGQPRRYRRGRSVLLIPDVPNAPSESMAFFYSNLAKSILNEAGGGLNQIGIFQSNALSSTPATNKNLHLAAFEVGLYALGLHNCVSGTWLSRTYSMFGSWVTSQAMELGSIALDVLVTSWEGHLTCSETVILALKASKARYERHREMQRAAAELALSCLHHCSSLTPNDIRNALIQCRQYSLPMLEKACNAVEISALETGRDGPIPEALFETSKQWEWLYLTSNMNESDAETAHTNQQNNLIVNNRPKTSFQRLDEPLPDAPPGNPPLNYGLPLITQVDFQFQNMQLQGQIRPQLPQFFPMQHQQQQMMLNNQLPMVQNVHRPPIAIPPIHADRHVPRQLEAAARVGLLALEHISRRAHDERGIKKNNSYDGDIMRLMEICIDIGQAKFDHFCQLIMKTLPSLKDCTMVVKIIKESAHQYHLRNNYSIPVNFRVPVIRQLIHKCCQQWHHNIINYAKQKGNQDLIDIILAAKEAFFFLPEGHSEWHKLITNESIFPLLSASDRHRLVTPNYHWQQPSSPLLYTEPAHYYQP